MANAVNRSIKLISPTNYVKGEIIKTYGTYKKKIAVTYEAAENISEAEREVVSLKNKKYILAIGNSYPHKNLKRLVDVMGRSELKDLTLVISGKEDYFYESIQNYVDQKGLKNIYLTGYVSDCQLEWLYKNASLYVFPSLSEGFGLPGLEAMSYGTPVASSNATCLPEVYGDAAVYFDPTSVDDMARVISDTLNDKELLAKLHKTGPEHAKKFSWEKMARETLEVYEKALKR